MIDTHDPARAPAAGSRVTSVRAWALVLAAATALLCARIPSFIDAAERAVAPRAGELGDPALSGAAVTVGAISAVAIHLLLLMLGALLATALERALGPAALGARGLGAGALESSRRGGRLRLGVGGLTFAVIVLGLQLTAAVLGIPAVERSWPVWSTAAGIALAAPAAFPACRASGARFGKALVASGGTAVLLCAG